jgi:iron(III) transport system ATP-binding protein
MKDGDIMQEGSPDQLYRSPASMFMANFMGDANIFRGFYKDGYLTINGYEIYADSGVTDGFPEGDYQIGVRPEAILIAGEGQACQQCQVKAVVYMGSMYEVAVNWHGQELLLQLNSSQFDPEISDHAYLTINPTGIFLLPADA